MQKRKITNPSNLKENVKRRKCNIARVQELGESFVEAVDHLFKSEDLDATIPHLSDSIVELTMVCLLGLTGIEALRFAVHHAPVVLCGSKRFNVVSTIMSQSSCHSGLLAELKDKSSEDLYQHLGSVLQTRCSSYWNSVPCESPHDTTTPQPPAYIDLHQISLSEGKLFTRFIGPPTSICLQPACLSKRRRLSIHNDPVNVTIFTLKGPVPSVKVTLRCHHCMTKYNYSMWGSKKSEGEQFYLDEERPLIEVSDTVYVERNVYQLFSTLSLHCWVSFSGFSEVYFDYSTSVNTEKHDGAQALLSQVVHPNKKDHSPIEFTRKNVSDMYFWGEIECEIRDKRENFPFHSNCDIEKYMKSVESSRPSVYPHAPSAECIEKGCGKCYTVDGNWKLTFPHCMFPVKSKVHLPGLNFADVCPNEPCGIKAFCEQHISLAEDRGYPTSVSNFVKYCRNNHGEDNQALDPVVETDSCNLDSNSTSSDKDMLSDVAVETDDVLKEQGTVQLIDQFQISDWNQSESSSSECRKDLGEKGKLRHWSRGHIFVVRSCGHIDTWKPIYKSESPSQVFLILISWLYNTLSKLDETDNWSDIVLAYDNMCHLDGLKVAKSPLPLPQPYDKMWLTITKVIDDLHIRNHKDKQCLAKYSPQPIKSNHPQYNFMTAEQTFVWLSRYKRILSSMRKTHHMYFLHRIVNKRNAYTEKCLKLGRKSLLPKAKNEIDRSSICNYHD